MSPRVKNLETSKSKPDERVLVYDLVSDLKRDHNELSILIGSFTNTLKGSDLRQSRKILCKIEGAAQRHFRFENGYLYPRMRRLLFVMLEKLGNEQSTIRDLIEKSQSILKNRNRLTKNSSTIMSEMALVASRHLKECDNIVLLADKFSGEEKNRLGQKLKECKK